MKLIYKKRRGGKTTKAVELCKKTGAYLLVLNNLWGRQVHEQYGLPLSQIKTHHQLLGGFLKGLKGDVIIDDVDSLIQMLTIGFNVQAITMSKPYSKAECLKYGISLTGSRT